MSERPRPLFVYGTLRALPLLAWALTGDSTKIDVVRAIVKPATVSGYTRSRLYHCDYPAIVPCISSTQDESRFKDVDGYLLDLETVSQRRKLDDFEGESYIPTAVTVNLVDSGRMVDADMYVWDGDKEQLEPEDWSLEWFVEERLGDWIEIFAGMELVG